MKQMDRSRSRRRRSSLSGMTSVSTDDATDGWIFRDATGVMRCDALGMQMRRCRMCSNG